MEDKENVRVKDAMDVDIPHMQESQHATQNVKEGEKRKKISLKRKRNFLINGNDADFNKHSVLYQCQQELDGLFLFFKDSLVPKLELGDCGGSSNDQLIACLMEGSSLSLPKLAEEIFGKIGMREGVTVEMVRRELPFVGSRVKYGVDNGNLNLGEDESETCLWCWEAREMSLLPKSQRGILKCLRAARKKVHSRISALSETLTDVSTLESVERSDLLKATEKLGHDMDISEIRSLIDRSMQKNTANAAEKEVRIKEREVLKELEKSKRNAEKEKKRIEQELLKEKARNEKELKKLKEEAEKEERRREKEEVEHKKLLKSQKDEAEREQKRHEKEEVEQKKKASMQRQALMMENLFKIKKTNTPSSNQENKISADMSSVSSEKNEVISTVISSMDLALSMQESYLLQDIHKTHIANWHKLRHFNRSLHWGIRRKPKSGLTNELKLHGFSSLPSKGIVVSKKTNLESYKPDSTLDESEEGFVDDLLGNDVNDIVSPAIQVCNIKRKLMQFDKSHRPAYYGSWSKKSQVVMPRRIFAKDPDLDYDVDSDEEWEEEEPGESLTDEKDGDDDETDDLQVDPDDESEDSFCVPDGYLSENEGVQEDKDDEVVSSLYCMAENETEEVRSLLQLQKQLQSITDKALRKSQPLIVSNLMHEKIGLLSLEDLTGVERIEKICLQSLCMLAYAGGCVDISVGDPVVDDEGICLTPNQPCPSPGVGSILDSYLPEFVKSIQSHSLGINKVIESIQQKFPALTKNSIRNKVREIADFVDNHHWQVKSEVMKKLGLHSPPGTHRKTQGIATFFSKRCLPPSKDISLSDSPSSLKKPKPIFSSDKNPNTNLENME